jgi:redox-sensitive bicupin YhaK (pirin superfamily)
MDTRLEKGAQALLPGMYNENAAFLFYVFSGKIQVSGDMLLSTGESVVIENEEPSFNALETTDIVLFITQKDAEHFDGGMYSGNLQA